MTKKKAAPATIEEKMEAALVPVEEQPYAVPGNWCWARLSSIYIINPKNNADDNIDAAFIPMEHISAGTNWDYQYDIQPWGKARKGHTQFANGDVAFAKISPCFENRKSMILQDLPNGIGGGTTELIILRQPLIDNHYTYWLIGSESFIQGGCQTYSGTVGQQRISMDYVREYPVPLPPFSEQRRIVDRIESLFAKLDEAKEKAQAVIDGYEERKAAILHKAFTGELTAQIRAEKGVGLDAWKKTTLGDIVTGFKYGTSEKSDYLNTGTPVFRIPNIGDGIIDFTDMKCLAGKSDESYLVYENDVLVIRSNGSRDLVGKCAIIPKIEGRYAYASFLIKVIPSDAIRPDYLVRFLNSSEARTQMFTKAKSSSGIHNINSKELGSITLKLPEPWEQIIIVTLIDALLAKEAAVKEAAETTLTTIDIMKQSILSRAFRGELGTNDPNDEPAEELLKRILASA